MLGQIISMNYNNEREFVAKFQIFNEPNERVQTHIFDVLRNEKNVSATVPNLSKN